MSKLINRIQAFNVFNNDARVPVDNGQIATEFPPTRLAGGFWARPIWKAQYLSMLWIGPLIGLGLRVDFDGQS